MPEMKISRFVRHCPRCGGQMKGHDKDGGMKSFPSVSLLCETKECYWGMTVTYDELSQKVTAEELLDKMITQWNEGIEKAERK